jgi:hypothetical protein
MHRLEANKRKKESISKIQSSTTFHKKEKYLQKSTSPLIDSWA